MNYRHIYHAGNFADLLKHAVLTALLAKMTPGPGSLTVIDTHAGAGVYDLAGEAARKTGEAAAGIGVLMEDAAAPTAFDALKASMREANGEGCRFYPGSPMLISAALGERDRLLACETRRDDFELLAQTLRRPTGATAVREDGWEVVARRTPAAPARALVLVDPPYEQADDAMRAAETTRRVLARNGGATIAVWAPIKDLTSFDALAEDVKVAAARSPVLVAEVRLRPLDNPLRLNGCAMIVVNPPLGVERSAREAAEWIARTLGEAGAVGHADTVGT